MSGWIKLYRELADHWLWAGEPFSKGQAWIDLLIYAHFSYEPKKIEIKGKIYVLQRGQQARSELTLSKRWMWSRGKIRRFLARLETDKMIVQHPDNKTSIITILNYDKYQKKQTADNTADDTTTGHHPDTTRYTIEEGKKDKNGSLKKGEKNDNMEYVGIGSINSSVFSLNYKSLKLGYWENNETGTKESDGQSAEISRSGNNNGNNSVDLLPCNGTNLSWSDLNGQPGQLSQTTLDNSGQGINDNLFVSNSGGDIWDSQAIIGLGSQEAMGTQGTTMDRRENEKEIIINDGMEAQAEDEDKPPKKAKEKNGIPYHEIVEILNEHTGKNFRHTTKQTQTLIKARWRDGYTIDDFRRVIAGRVEKWIGDPKMCEYLRPPTLFGSKFESYLQAESTAKKITLPKTNNKINCKECSNIGSCRNAEENPIASCALYTHQKETVAA